MLEGHETSSELDPVSINLTIGKLILINPDVIIK